MRRRNSEWAWFFARSKNWKGRRQSFSPSSLFWHPRRLHLRTPHVKLEIRQQAG